MAKIKLKKAYFIMALWQTGNIGSKNIGKVEGQPEEGFKDEDSALEFLIDNPGKAIYHSPFQTYTILPIYEPVTP